MKAEPISLYEDKPIGSFLRWAQERIAKEMEMINESEIQDASEIYSPKKRPGVKLPSIEYMTDKIREVDASRDKGIFLPEATKLAGINPGKYASWRKHLNLGRYNRNVSTK